MPDGSPIISVPSSNLFRIVLAEGYCEVLLSHNNLDEEQGDLLALAS